ncbi:PilW family protein [Paraglaciecola aquimarina]|uniref:PilW family protein n=1 Tax=Paraglaciecola algarum TaxID=3050085 RepID=A0ABS9D957_9ALTE|nr:PilW family protein [Paraglaciecola sp. G1-23]MCF2948339.1 PilW family protein [Paraglaciecola sp. G1-23]
MKKQQGFTLIELMISLTIGLIISASIIQVMISNNATERLNRALASAQENGRFIISRLRTELLTVGRYDIMEPNLNTDVDPVVEAAFVHNTPIPIPGDFSNALGKGSVEGASGASDILMVSMQGTQDCRGLTLGYAANEEFFVVNEYFLDGTTLKCRGFDGRVLRGQKVAVGNDSDNAYTLLDDVYSFQVQYGVTEGFATTDNSARPVQFLTANDLAAAKAAGQEVVAIRIAVLVKADSDIVISPIPSFKLLNEAAITPSEKRLFKQFETTIILRNSKNTIRSRNI